MKSMSVWNREKGIFTSPDGRVVAADSHVIGEVADPWMHIVAGVEAGVYTASDAIKEVVGFIYRKEFNASPVYIHTKCDIPPELFERAKDPVKNPDEAKMLAELFETIYFNRGE